MKSNKQEEENRKNPTTSRLLSLRFNIKKPNAIAKFIKPASVRLVDLNLLVPKLNPNKTQRIAPLTLVRIRELEREHLKPVSFTLASTHIFFSADKKKSPSSSSSTTTITSTMTTSTPTTTMVKETHQNDDEKENQITTTKTVLDVSATPKLVLQDNSNQQQSRVLASVGNRIMSQNASMAAVKTESASCEKKAVLKLDREREKSNNSSFDHFCELI
jgi:hypothetical protein